jgi:hypothetical protein
MNRQHRLFVFGIALVGASRHHLFKGTPTLYFPDLSPYGYSMASSLPDVLNIGWLDRSEPFSKGAVPKLLVDRLKSWFQLARVNQMRGIHECNLCRAEQWPLLPLQQNPSVSIEGRTLFLGNWEIWIPTSGGRVFASPALIVHYVEAHGYQPPGEFISAVMNDNAIENWDADAEFARRTNVERR